MDPPDNAFIGYRKLTHMEPWAQDDVDVVVPGFIEFQPEDDHLTGTFQFGAVSGWLDCRLRDLEGVASIEWSGVGVAPIRGAVAAGPRRSPCSPRPNVATSSGTPDIASLQGCEKRSKSTLRSGLSRKHHYSRMST